MNKYLAIVLMLLSSNFSLAQNSDLGNWAIIIANKKLTNKFDWHHELQYRNYNFVGNLEQLLLRTGLGMSVGKNASALLGYGFIRSENYINEIDQTVINEHRMFQQFISKQMVSNIRLQHRYRFEQRLVKGISKDDYKLRFRYFLGINVPLWKNDSNELYLSVYDEVFLNTVGNPFDRNRLYGGLGYRLNQKTRIEIGYMNQFLFNGSRDQLNIIYFYNY